MDAPPTPAVDTAAAARSEPAAGRAITRRYVDARDGQVHLHEAGDPASARPTLCCLHATAYSGRSFAPLMRALAGGRHLIAPDTPGYGGSDAPAERPAFTDYAEALSDAITASGAAAQGPVDLFGYHTGALLATEIAWRRPALVRRLVLMGIPYFHGIENQAAWRERLVHTATLTESDSQFEHRWRYFITHRTPGLSLERAFDCYVDELRAYPRDGWAHEALFDHDAAPALRGVQQPVLVINPANALAAASRDAAALLPNGRLLALAEAGGAPFDLLTDRLATEIATFLDDDTR